MTNRIITLNRKTLSIMIPSIATKYTIVTIITPSIITLGKFRLVTKGNQYRDTQHTCNAFVLFWQMSFG